MVTGMYVCIIVQKVNEWHLQEFIEMQKYRKMFLKCNSVAACIIKIFK